MKNFYHLFTKWSPNYPQRDTRYTLISLWQSQKIIHGDDNFYLALKEDVSGMDIDQGTPENSGIVLWKSKEGGSDMTTAPPTKSPATTAKRRY